MAHSTRPPETAARTAPRRPRLHFVDNIRVALTVLVVLHHVAVTYGTFGLWFYSEPATDPSAAALDLFVVANQAYFMGLFFLISGFFVPGSLDRKGPRPFLRDRLVRLGVPLLGFLLFLRPLLTTGTYEDLRAAGHDMPYWFFYLVSWDPGPLWFVEVLLALTIGYVLLRRVRAGRTAAPAEPAGPPAPRPGPGPLAVIGFVVALTLITYLWRSVNPAVYWPVVGLPSPGFLPQYIALFAVGVLAARRGWTGRVPAAAGWTGLAVAVAGTLVFLPFARQLLEAAPGSWQSLANAAWENVFAAGMITALLALFSARLNRQGRLGRFLSDNAFAVYVLHPLVLVAAGYALSGWQAIGIAKFAVAALICVPLCWALAALVRGIPYARRVL
ncbi:acyltransferase family protein [Marinactinospora rubrisoli]|uniref:Acyltransferase n=1 Tax=Marinactinospora rubrisoli TaxID=2715399 RepID=A0ABW2KN64_9ACTN